MDGSQGSKELSALNCKVQIRAEPARMGKLQMFMGYQCILTVAGIPQGFRKIARPLQEN